MQYQLRHAGVTDTGNVGPSTRTTCSPRADLAAVADGMGDRAAASSPAAWPSTPCARRSPPTPRPAAWSTPRAGPTPPCGPHVEPHAVETVPARSDRLLLCSDGLFNELTDGEITEVLVAVADPGEAASRLVQLANEQGGHEDVTAVVVDVE
jgi:serine/threonine protein phosphatase PrpC